MNIEHNSRHVSVEQANQASHAATLHTMLCHSSEHILHHVQSLCYRTHTLDAESVLISLDYPLTTQYYNLLNDSFALSKV